MGARKTLAMLLRDSTETALFSSVLALVKAQARAFRYQQLLDEGRYASISEMAAAERIERGYLGSLLRLTLLAPDIVAAILDGRQPAELGLPTLMEAVPPEWDAQRTALAGAPAPA